jgi:hypothetical protein
VEQNAQTVRSHLPYERVSILARHRNIDEQDVTSAASQGTPGLGRGCSCRDNRAAMLEDSGHHLTGASPCSTRMTASACWTPARIGMNAPACSRPRRSVRSSRRSERSGGQSLEATGSAASNLDADQINCTFYDALGGRDDEHLVARAIPCFRPGIPHVYYVGLLAGRNDMTLLARTGVGSGGQDPV